MQTTIKIKLGQKPVVTLSASQKRALRTTLEIVELIAAHIDPVEGNLNTETGTPVFSSASCLLDNGLENFVRQYAQGESDASQTLGGAGKEAKGT